MNSKSKKWIKTITYLLPFIWLFLRNFFPVFMQFNDLDTQGWFLMFVLFGLCSGLITYPNFETVTTIFSGKPDDKRFIHSSKVMFVIFMIIDVLWMLYSVSIFNVFTFWINNIGEIIFLFSLTWYLWFSFSLNMLRYVDVINYAEDNKLEKELV